MTIEHEPFIAAIMDDPDDLSRYSVFADYLQEQGDAWGDFMRVQIELEGDLEDAQRKHRKLIEASLLHNEGLEKRLLGGLAPELLPVEKGPSDAGTRWASGLGGRPQWQFARGFLDQLQIDYPVPSTMAALRESPQIKLLRTLELTEVPDGETLADDLPDLAKDDWTFESAPSLDELLAARFPNLRHFEIDGEYAVAWNVELVLRNMPRLERLEISARWLDSTKICGAKLPQLQHLALERFADNPLPALARNASLGQLEEIDLFPHMLEPGDEPYLDLEGLTAICRSSSLPSLRRLSLTCADFGDFGIDMLIGSGLLARLEVLELQYGAVTDNGARMLASQDLSRLRRLNLGGNYLSPEGVEALRSAFPRLDASHQHSGTPDGDRQHLWYGDME